MTSPALKKFFTSLGFAVLSVPLAIAIYVWAVLSWSYSEGERAGFLQKVSYKGWICKTWEGELSLVAIPGAAPEKFLFTVRDDAVAQQLNAVAGKRVTLKYEQHRGLPTSCFGDTDYFVVGVAVID
ncbi:MAG: hypothetical protein RL462_331 [Pseudomonadota bacterium]|jgi:hypothetical protein